MTLPGFRADSKPVANWPRSLSSWAISEEEAELGDLGPREWVSALFCQTVIGQYISSSLPQFLSCETGDKSNSCFIGTCGDLFIVHLSSYLLVPTTCQAEPRGYSRGQSPDPVAPWMELWSGWDDLEWYIHFSRKIHQYRNRVPAGHWGALGVSRSGAGRKWWAEAGVAGAERTGSPVPCEAGWEKDRRCQRSARLWPAAPMSTWPVTAVFPGPAAFAPWGGTELFNTSGPTVGTAGTDPEGRI